MDRSTARSGRARIATGIVGGAIAVLLVSTSVLGGGGGFSGATTLRTGDDDVDVVLSDAATNGDRVAVGGRRSESAVQSCSTGSGEQGRRMGAHTVVGGDVREVEAWDETFTDAMNQRIRFRRQL